MSSGMGSNETTSPIIKLALVLLFVIFLIHHWYILYAQPLLPGFDGGYYAVQVREILRSSKLYYSAPPIAFLIFSFFAEIFLILNLFPPPLCVINGVKFGLALMKSLCIFPAYLIFKQLTKRDYVSIGGAILLELNPFFMLLANGTSLFKNAIGVFFLLCYIYYVNELTIKNSWREIILALIFISLTAMTHILDFGLALAYTILYAAIEAIVNKRLSMKSSITKLITIEFISIAALFAGILTIAPVFFGTYYKFESFIEELLIVEGNEGAMLPPMLEPFVALAIILAIIGLIISLIPDMGVLEKRLLLSSSLLVLFLITPLYSPQWYIRFILVTFIPATLTLPTMLKLIRDTKKVIAFILVLVIFFTPAYMQLSQARPVINPIEFRDIMDMAPYIERGNTIIITRFGLHYWVTWFLDIETTYHINKLDNYIQQYEHVYLIIEKWKQTPSNWTTIYEGKELKLIKIK